MFMRIKILILVVFTVSAISGCASFFYGPGLPKMNTIPQDISQDIRREIERLYSKKPLERAQAAIRLGEMGERAEDAIPFLIGILYDGRPLYRPEDWPEGEIYFEKISRLTKDKRINVTRRSVGSIGALALSMIGEEAIGPLMEALDVKTLTYVHYLHDVATALAAIGAPATDSLIAALYHKNPVVRSGAAEALYMSEDKDPRAVMPLIARLKDQDLAVRIWAAYALSQLGDSRAIKPFEEILSGYSFPCVEAAAAEGLGNLNSMDSLVLLSKRAAGYPESSSAENSWCYPGIAARRAIDQIIGALHGNNNQNTSH